MEYIQGISTQTTLFLYSLALGFGLGVIYDVFRTLRMFVPRVKWLTVTADILYFTLCGVISFFFVLVTDEGKLRVYTVLGIMLGWCIWYFSFGVLAMKISSAVVKGIKHFFSLISKPVRLIFRKIIRFARKTRSFFKKTARKSRETRCISIKSINIICGGNYEVQKTNFIASLRYNIIFIR